MIYKIYKDEIVLEELKQLLSNKNRIILIGNFTDDEKEFYNSLGIYDIAKNEEQAEYLIDEPTPYEKANINNSNTIETAYVDEDVEVMAPKTYKKPVKAVIIALTIFAILAAFLLAYGLTSGFTKMPTIFGTSSEKTDVKNPDVDEPIKEVIIEDSNTKDEIPTPENPPEEPVVEVPEKIEPIKPVIPEKPVEPTPDPEPVVEKAEILYKSNNPSNESKTLDGYKVGQTVKIIQNPFTYKNYEFKGWNTKSDGTGKSYNAGSDLEIFNKRVILYAQWEQKSVPYTVTHFIEKPDGYELYKTETFEGKAGTIVEAKALDEISELGYSCITEYKKGKLEEDKNLLIKLYYDANTITITYIKSTYEVDNVTDTVKVGFDYEIKDNTFTYTGYKFKEWTTNPFETSTTYKPGDKVTFNKDTYLFAKWEADLVSYDVKHYFGRPGSYALYSRYTYKDTVGSTIKNTDKAITIDGYKLVTEPKSYTLTSNSTVLIELYYDEEPITITLNSNNSDNLSNKTNYHKFDTATIPENSFNYPGYFFLCWNTQSDGSGTNYYPNNSVYMTESLTLYAQWEQEIDGSATFRNDDGSLTTLSWNEMKLPENRAKYGYYQFEDDEIGVGDFRQNQYLVEIRIPETVTTIGNGAFYGSPLLEKVEFLNSPAFIGQVAFENCSSLKTIIWGDNVQKISDNAFNNTGLETLYVPNTEFGHSVFSYSSKLKNITFDPDLESIPEWMFYDSTGIESVTIPNTIKNVGNSAFWRCSNLKTLNIESGLETIGAYAFEKTAIKELILPDTVTFIGDNAFSENRTLQKVVIGNGVKTISERAFFWTDVLSDVKLGSNVETIGDYAFSGANLTSVYLPKAVKTIGKNAFDDNNIVSIEFEENGTLTDIGAAAFFKSKISELKLPLTVESIGNSAFAYNTNLTNVSFGNSLKNIGDNAFYECNLTEVILPDSLISIGGYAFYKNNNLSILSLGNNVQTIGYMAFYGTNIDSLHIPASITELGEYSFWSAHINTLTFDEGIEKIGNSAFRDNNISTLNLPESLKEIGGFAFSGNNISSIVMPSNLEIIDDNAFYGNYNLQEVILNDNLKKIGSQAFLYTNILKLDIPASVESLGTQMAGFNSFTGYNVDVNNPNYSSENGSLFNKDKTLLISFWSNTIMPTYNIPDTVEVIAEEAFNWPLINVIYIPSSVKEIGNRSIIKYDILTDIFYEGTQEEFNAIAKPDDFYDFLQGITIHFADSELVIPE